MTERATGRSRRTPGLFDLRFILATLFAVYGVIVTLVGIVSTSQEDLDRAAGININLWMGIAMLVAAVLFGAWAYLRPVVPDAAEPDPEVLPEEPPR